MDRADTNPLGSRTPKNMLIAEDDPNDRMVLARIAKGLENRVRFHFVRDGDEVIDYLNGSERFADRAVFPLPDLVLVDMHMPVLSGLETLQWIRRDPRFSGLKVFAWSGSESMSEFEAMRAAGADWVMPRPREYEELQALVRDFAERLWQTVSD
jgi:CheY-like chemotaxis protein